MLRSVTLRGGQVLPSVGLGVYKCPSSETEAVVTSALSVGYRHVDTAQVYGNELPVGNAVEAFEASHPGERVFITTKLWKASWGYDACNNAVLSSLEKLRRLDLVLLHAPGDAATRAETWRALEDNVKAGRIGSIGVSNFSEAHLNKLEETATILPSVNQLEIHPWLQRRELAAYCAKMGIVVEAYSPLAKGGKLSDPVVVQLAEAVKKTPAQVLIRWSLQHGYVPLPKSVQQERQAANLAVFDFTLDDAQMATLDGLECGLITGWDPVTSDPV